MDLKLKFNSDGLIPAIAQDYKTGEVLMLAYMDQEAFDLTVKTGKESLGKGRNFWSFSVCKRNKI